jgi:cysteine desulfurase family protein
MNSEIIYFDNAATSFPKPEETLLAVQHCMREVGGSPGRSGHRLSIEAARIILDTRETLAGLFGAPDPLSIVLTKNATEALNIAIFGLLRPGDHVITSGMEHNSLMRPLRFLETEGVALSVIPCSPAGEMDPNDIIPAINGKTKTIFLIHASNVTGAILPVAEVGRIAREHDLIFCVDAAQTAGALPIDVVAMNIDLLAFTGHKSLYGPQGTGGLYIREGLDKTMAPLMHGGTGSRSEYEQQPDFMPDRYESGTLNTPGMAGLGAGAGFIAAMGVEKVRAFEETLTGLFLGGIEDIDGIEIFGPRNPSRQVPIVSFRIRGTDPAEMALELEEQFNILCRPGLHCAPSAHRTIGSFPEGTVRFSFGYFNRSDQVRVAVNALRRLSARHR